MTYRSSPAQAPPRVLVVRPQRAATAAVFLVLGLLFTLTPLVEILRATLREGPKAAHAMALLFSAFGSIFLLSGLHSWLLRVDLVAHADGVLTMTWTRWPFARRVRTLALSEITDVEVETDDGTSKIVIVVGQERLPLTGSATSDDLTDKASELKAFLRVPARPTSSS